MTASSNYFMFPTNLPGSMALLVVHLGYCLDCLVTIFLGKIGYLDEAPTPIHASFVPHILQASLSDHSIYSLYSLQALSESWHSNLFFFIMTIVQLILLPSI